MKGFEFPSGREMETPHELVAVLQSQEWIVEVHLGNPRHGPENDVLDAGLRGCRHRNRVPVATQAGGDP